MTLEEKINRYRSIPKRIAELEIDKDICTSVKAVQYDSIGDAKGTPENNAERKMVDAAAISAEITELEKEHASIRLELKDSIDQAICGEDIHSVDMRMVLKSHLLQNVPLNQVAKKVVHRDYSATRKMYQEGFAMLKNLT